MAININMFLMNPNQSGLRSFGTKQMDAWDFSMPHPDFFPPHSEYVRRIQKVSSKIAMLQQIT